MALRQLLHYRESLDLCHKMVLFLVLDSWFLKLPVKLGTELCIFRWGRFSGTTVITLKTVIFICKKLSIPQQMLHQEAMEVLELLFLKLRGICL